MTEIAETLVRLLGQFGPWGGVILVVIFVVAFPERAETIAGWLLSLFAWTGTTVRRRSIIATVQGRVSEFARSIDREAHGLMPYNMRLRFVKEIDRAELEAETDTIIVRIRDQGDTERNLVSAMLAFGPAGCVPHVRPYLDRVTSQAIDLTITRKFLLSTRQHVALEYLSERVAAYPDEANLSGQCQTLTELDERGLFTRVFLGELRDLGSILHTQHPRAEHAEEVRAFLAYVEKIAKRGLGEELRQLGYRGRYIATAFVLVGRVETMLDSGAKRYLDHLRRLRDLGYQRVFLAARDRERVESGESLSAKMAKRVGALAVTGGLAEKVAEMRFLALDTDGLQRAHVLIELAMLAPS